MSPALLTLANRKTRPLPVPEAAAALGVHVATLRRWLSAGAPQARRGRRGNGGGALVDIEAIRAWQRVQAGQGCGGDVLRAVAAEIPDILADAMHDAHRLIEGPDKRRAAGYLAAAGLMGAQSVLDRLRREDDSIAELVELPRKLRTLRDISRESGSLAPSINETPRG